MNWNLGFSSSVYIELVDPVTWRDVQRLEITGGTVERKEGGLAESASVDCVDFDTAAEHWIRIYMDVWQGGASEHVPVFTGLATSPGRNINGTLFSNTVDCFSVLKPADDVLLPLGWYAQAGAEGASLAAQLLNATPAPVVVADNSPTLASSYVAESGETNLTMANKILEAINWRLRITGDGTISIEPKATEPAASFDALENDSVEPVLSVSHDWYSCPNVFRAVRSGVSAVAYDTDPDSIFSTVSRGREIWKEEQNCKLNNGESLDDYAARRLKECQQVVYTANYDRRFNPAVVPGDLVRLHYPAQKIDGLFRVVSQSIDLTVSCRTSEESELYE